MCFNHVCAEWSGFYDVEIKPGLRNCKHYESFFTHWLFVVVFVVHIFFFSLKSKRSRDPGDPPVILIENCHNNNWSTNDPGDPGNMTHHYNHYSCLNTLMIWNAYPWITWITDPQGSAPVFIFCCCLCCIYIYIFSKK